MGRRTRRLIAELAAGEVVELTRDRKGRPALRRQWGQAGSRLFTYGARLLRAPAAGVVQVQIDLGLHLSLVRDLPLRGAAGSRPRGELQSLLETAPGRVVVKTHRGRSGAYLADVYGLDGEHEPAVIAERGDYLKRSPGRGDPGRRSRRYELNHRWSISRFSGSPHGRTDHSDDGGFGSCREREPPASPELRKGWLDGAAIVAQARLAVPRQQQRSVEIDPVGALGRDHGGRHGQGGAHHAAHHRPAGPRPGHVSPSSRAAVSPPVLSSLMLTAS